MGLGEGRPISRPLLTPEAQCTGGWGRQGCPLQEPRAPAPEAGAASETWAASVDGAQAACAPQSLLLRPRHGDEDETQKGPRRGISKEPEAGPTCLCLRLICTRLSCSGPQEPCRQWVPRRGFLEEAQFSGVSKAEPEWGGCGGHPARWEPQRVTGWGSERCSLPWRPWGPGPAAGMTLSWESFIQSQGWPGPRSDHAQAMKKLPPTNGPGVSRARTREGLVTVNTGSGRIRALETRV